MVSRRKFISGAAAAIGTVPLAPSAQAADSSTRNTNLHPEQILALFHGLPGVVGLKIVAPAVSGKPGFQVEQNASRQMFVGSAIKTFILCEAMRQADSPDVVKKISSTQLPLDAGVWTLDSSILNPPNLIGKISLRTAMEAMIIHSDNTGTDMSMLHAGADNVRKFIAGAGLRQTQVPDSTRTFFGYLLGAKNYKTYTWEDLCAAANLPIVNPPLNPVETLASSADDMVRYYTRALAGGFFQHKETLAEFRRILSLGDAIALLPVPLGVSAYCKGGSIDVPGSHAVCASGAMTFGDRWVYFSMTINWDAKETTDPKTTNAFLAAGSRALTMVKDALA
jgi:beta-lactamase class A